MTDHTLELAQIVRDGFSDCGGPGWNDAERAFDAILEMLEYAKTEIAYTHARGDHLVYHHQWEAFDAWQRNARRWNQQRMDRATKVREAADSTPAGNPIWKAWALDLCDDVEWLVNESYVPAEMPA